MKFSRPIPFPAALTRVLESAARESVTPASWRDRLDDLHREHRTWSATAEALGVDDRTLERWRYGYQPKRRADGTRPARQQVDPATFVPKIRAALAASRRYQVNLVDWKRLKMHGAIEFYPDQPPKWQTISLGPNISQLSLQGIVQAYLAADADLMQTAVDVALSVDYLPYGTTVRLVEVDELGFG